MKTQLGFAGLTCLMILGLMPAEARADFEVSLGFNFNQTTYEPGSYSWTRRWGASIGYEFLDRSQLEFSFQDIMDRTKIVSYEDTTFHDRVYSFNWVQSLAPRTFPIQPYVKAGIGQHNRDAQGTYASGAATAKTVDAVTAIVGAGLRVYITRAFALRAEATSYLEGGNVRTWKDNISAQFGVSVYF